jgi:hypothetical protein
VCTLYRNSNSDISSSLEVDNLVRFLGIIIPHETDASIGLFNEVIIKVSNISEVGALGQGCERGVGRWVWIIGWHHEGTG